MKTSVFIKYLRVSPKKLKALGEATVGLPPQKAIERLIMAGTKGSNILAKVVKSALANVTKNLKLEDKRLRIKTVEVLKGPFSKRWQPVARGVAHQIKKRTSHIRVIIEEIKDLKTQNLNVKSRGHERGKIKKLKN